MRMRKEPEMYLIRRGFVTKPWITREAAKLVDEVAKGFEKAGRSSTRVYWSGHTVPGPANTVYMDWTQETLSSPYAPDANVPEGLEEVYDRLVEVCEDSFIEFYEMV